MGPTPSSRLFLTARTSRVAIKCLQMPSTHPSVGAIQAVAGPMLVDIFVNKGFTGANNKTRGM